MFLPNSLVAQSGEWRVLGGAKMSSRWQKQPYNISGGDVFWHIKATQPIDLVTYSLIYSHPINAKWAWSVGINYNAKGFKEKGIYFDPTIELIPHNFENNNIMKYIGGLVGARYTFVDKKGWRFGSEILLNPEIEKEGYRNLRKLAVSSLFLFNVEKTITPHLSLVLNPFVETGLMRYSKSNEIAYTPFGYGLTLGVKYVRN